MNQKLLKEVRMFLDFEGTQHLYIKAEDTEDTEDTDELEILLQRAKRIISQSLSEAEQLINKIKKNG